MTWNIKSEIHKWKWICDTCLCESGLFYVIWWSPLSKGDYFFAKGSDLFLVKTKTPLCVCVPQVFNYSCMSLPPSCSIVWLLSIVLQGTGGTHLCGLSDLESLAHTAHWSHRVVQETWDLTTMALHEALNKETEYRMGEGPLASVHVKYLQYIKNSTS